MQNMFGGWLRIDVLSRDSAQPAQGDERSAMAITRTSASCPSASSAPHSCGLKHVSDRTPAAYAILSALLTVIDLGHCFDLFGTNARSPSSLFYYMSYYISQLQRVALDSRKFIEKMMEEQAEMRDVQDGHSRLLKQSILIQRREHEQEIARMYGIIGLPGEEYHEEKLKYIQGFIEMAKKSQNTTWQTSKRSARAADLRLG